MFIQALRRYGFVAGTQQGSWSEVIVQTLMAGGYNEPNKRVLL
jgi:hypothetical protein